jgi:molybdate transport system permease protein
MATRAESSNRTAVSGAPAVWLAAALLVLFLILPLIALVYRAFARETAFSSETWRVFRQAIWLSAYTSAASLAVILLMGAPLAYLLARGRIPGGKLVETLVDLPMVLPPAVAGLGLLMAFGRRGIVGTYLDDFGVTVGFTPWAVVIAQTFVATPFFVRSARAGFTRVDRALEEAAADLGAPPRTVFRTVTLPMALPGIAAGAVLAWARAVGEFGATIMFAGNFPGRTQTMSLAIYGRYEGGDLNTALLLAVILLAGSMLVLLAARLVTHGRSWAG